MIIHKNIIFFFLLYISLIIGFFLNENLNYGSYSDWVSVNLPPIKDFSTNFYDTLLSYEKYGHRHSPIYLIFLSFFLKLGLNFEIIRLIHLHLSLSLIFIFYQCLKLHFKEINKYTLQILAFVIFLSPTFRSLSIWPDSRLPGLIFFTISIYFFLKFLISLNYKYSWLCSISLIIASYISPNFSLFSIYFYFIFYKKMKISRFINLMLVNLAASIPMLYYLFVLDVNFILAGKTPELNMNAASLNFNFSNKILIISSIIFFHLIPIIFYLIDFKKFISFFKKKLIFTILGSLILFYFFNYQLNFTGGGVFFQSSQIIFKKNILFFIISFFSLTILFYLSNINISNFFIIFLTIISNIQNSIYHKYYEVLILIMIFVLFKGLNYKNFFSNKKSLLFLYFYSLFFIFLRIIKNAYLV